MKRNEWLAALLIAASFALPIAGAQAEDAAKGATAPAAAANTSPPPGFEAKFTYCRTCHGLSGQGFRADLTMPRLAGQQPDYFKNQVQAFIDRRRKSNVMYNVAHVLTPGMLDAIIAGFDKLNPKALPPVLEATQDQIAQGKKIFTEGNDAANIPPCSSCHGEDAKGNSQFPRLAGQPDDYIVKKLTNWDKERGQDTGNPDTSAIMQPIAHNLKDDQIKAVAAYLTRLE